MKCIYCNKPVYGSNGVSVPGEGPAHKDCLTVVQTYQRKFRNIDISALTDAELTDLHDLVLAELNDRRGDDEDIELF